MTIQQDDKKVRWAEARERDLKRLVVSESGHGEIRPSNILARHVLVGTECRQPLR